MLELVTSGRSVAMVDAGVGHSPATETDGAIMIMRMNGIAGPLIRDLRFIKYRGSDFFNWLRICLLEKDIEIADVVR